ncbi:MAG TPA: amino acid adenylation domain-containing protein, partial [Niastella sp.]
MYLEQIIDELIRLNISLKVSAGELVVTGAKESLAPEMIARIKENKQALIQYLQSAELAHHLMADIPVSAPEASYPLSSSQQRMWILSQFGQLNTAYNLSYVYTFKGDFQRRALEHAFERLIERHEILRTVFRENEQGEVRQYICSLQDTRFAVENYDLRLQPNDLNSLVNKVCATVFDLQRGPLIRAVLFELENGEQVFCCVMHHIISDGWSMKIVIKELLEFYKAYVSGKTDPIPPLRIQYKDYACWQQEQLTGRALEKQQAYWLTHFQGSLPVLAMPTDGTRAVTRLYQARCIRKVFDREVTQGVRQLCQENGATLYMGLMAALTIVLNRYTDQDDIIIGSPIAGREHVELEQQIGFYVNTIALRMPVSRNASYKELLQIARQVTLDAYANQAYPFDELINKLDLQRDVSRHPLFDVMVVMHNNSRYDASLQGIENLSIQEYGDRRTQFSKLDLVFNFIEENGLLQLDLEYDCELFHVDTIDRLTQHLHQVLISALQNPLMPVGQLDMLPAGEKEQLLNDFNNTDYPVDANKTLINLFEEQVRKTPGKTAVVFEDRSLTYQQLNERANQLAHYLLTKYNIAADDRVGLLLERSEWMLVAILGVLKSGGAYVPIDPAYPADRTAYMKEDSGCKVIIDDHWLRHFTKERDQYKMADPLIKTDPQHLAYIIYTSGSTGQSKGVMIEHGSLVNFMQAMSELFPMSVGDRLLAVTTYSFDISYLELFLPLLAGGIVHIVSRDDYHDGHRLSSMISTWLPRYMQATPSAWRMLLETGWVPDGRMQLLIGGEALPEALKESLLNQDNKSIWNLYGPTEATIWCTVKELRQGDRVNIGKPLRNTQVYIVNSSNQLMPVGVGGELCVGGIGLARGYWNRTELTAAKFIANPFGSGRLYRTGDIARWLPDGNIECLGRIDDQVKIRGYRIELGEIEHVIQSSGLAAQSVVVAQADETGVNRLVGYIVPKGLFNSSALQDYLAACLPEHMIPSLLIAVETMPLTPNGKVNKKALPAPEGSIQKGSLYVAPRSVLEQKLCAIWQQVLQLDRIGIHDDFFQLGGHSLKATRVVSAIRKTIGVELPIRELFIHSTIARLATLIKGKDTKSVSIAIESIMRPARLPLSFSQERLWFIDRLEGSFPYYIPVILRLQGNLDIEALEQSIATIVNRHEVLRSVLIEQEGELWQELLPKDTWRLERIEQEGLIENTERLRSVIAQLVKQPFDLSQDHKLRCHIVTGRQENILVAVMHHIAADGWSVSILVNELVQLYNSYAKGRKDDLPPLALQYSDFAVWQRSYFVAAVLQPQIDYWKQQLAGAATLQLPTDFPRPAWQSNRGAMQEFFIHKTLVEQLMFLSDQHASTLFMTMLSVFKILLYRYSDQEDICVGTAIANRRQAELENLIGFFANTMVVRTALHGEMNFVELLNKVRDTLLDGYEHQDVPFERLVELLVKDRDRSRNPLFQVMFVMQNTPGLPELRLGDVIIKEEKYHQQTAKFDLNVSINTAGKELAIRVEYCTDLFKPSTIERLIKHYLHLLQAVVKEPLQPLASLPLLDEAERQQLLNGFNDTAYPVDADLTLVSLFEQQVIQSAAKTAVVFEDRSLSYQQLNERANQLADCLLAKYKIAADDRVALLLERSEWMLVAILGVLKSGGAYVPIDPAYPADRIAYMKADSGCKVVIDDNWLQHFITDCDRYKTTTPPVKVGPQDLAYIIYTSGSTGRPKGVMIEHQGIVNRLWWMWEQYGLGSNDVILQKTTYTFDVSVWELLLPLCRGAKLVVCRREDAGSPERLLSIIERTGITCLHFVPAMLTAFIQGVFDKADIKGRLKSVRMVITSGEALLAQTVKAWYETVNIPIHNLYGPTEASVDVSYYATSVTDSIIPIGRPIWNTQLYIIGSGNALMPIGVPGEICIGGIGLARGYLNLAGQTAEKFIAHPFIKDARIYRTGDKGRWLSDGNIEYLGRIDNQVKIRGYRIEPGEVEAVIQQSGLVGQCVVIAQMGDGGINRLIGYIVPKDSFDSLALQAYLAARLPEYMIPSALITVQAIPLTPNGKVDRKALPPPDANMLKGNAYVAPRSDLEQKLCAIWQQVLHIEQVGIKDNFFELGGHSLSAIQLVSHYHKTFNCRIELTALFTYKTIEEQAALIAQASRETYSPIPLA